jgi:hypothetical protein
MRGCLALFIVAAARALSACSSPRPQGVFRPTSGELVELNIITAPVGLNLDGPPGLDGFSVKVYANIAANPKPVPIRSGTLEVLMFDGTFYGRTNVPPALRVWSFTAEELRPLEFTARIGTGYDFLLPWGTNRPTRQLISIAARYTSAEGKVLTSRPSSVTVLDQ